ncbi:MAG: hypothetical protein AAGK04_11145 [Planctomycetota bacterium]
MLKVQDGQCGKCAHFGDDASPKFTQVRIKGEAPEDLVAECGSPAHEGEALRVTAISSCGAFTPAN